MSGARHYDQDKDSTVYVGNLDERVTDAVVWEMCVNMGPVVNIHLPKDRVTQQHQGFGFVEMGSPKDADYACAVLNAIRVWGKPIRVNKANAPDKRNEAGGTTGVGAELFIGNLDSMIDEKGLFETFSRFGPLIAAPKLARDDVNLPKGFGFVSYATFEASDDAIASMHGQFLGNKEVTVQYAYKKDGKGERHGDAAERALAAQAKKNNVTVEIPAMPSGLTGIPTAPAGMGNGAYPPQMKQEGAGYYQGGGYQMPIKQEGGGYYGGGYGGGAPAYSNYGAYAPGYPPAPAYNNPAAGYAAGAGYSTGYNAGGYSQPYNTMPPPAAAAMPAPSAQRNQSTTSQSGSGLNLPIGRMTVDNDPYDPK